MRVMLSFVCCLYPSPSLFLCLQFQNVQHVIADIMTRMYNTIGTPEDAKRRENAWRMRLVAIEEKLNAFQKSHIIPPVSPESQVSFHGNWLLINLSLGFSYSKWVTLF